MEAFAVSFGLIALAEIGDKTQLLALVLATRFRRPLPIVSGIFVALLCDYALAEAAAGAEKPLWFGLQAWRSVMAGLSLVFVLAKIKETRGFELEEMT